MAFTKITPPKRVQDLTPLDVSCTSTRCEDDLHCFKLNQRLLKRYGREGVCRVCGADLIDWERIRRQGIKDPQYLFQSLKKELIRHVYWHTRIEDKAIENAQRRGRRKIEERAKCIIRSKLGKGNNPWDGRQTPKTGGEIIHYAQHATATCCRKCLEYWHNIPTGRELTDQEVDFCSTLIMYYVVERVPDLPAETA